MKVGVYQLVEPLPAVGSLACYRSVDTRTDVQFEVRLLPTEDVIPEAFSAIRKRLLMAALVKSTAARAIELLEFDAHPMSHWNGWRRRPYRTCRWELSHRATRSR